jgi:putative endonuclease
MITSAPDLGSEGEKAVGRHMESLGYQIVSRRFRARQGELDLVCQHDEVLAVVEVKTRRGSSESPAEAVGPAKRRSMRAAWAEYRRLSGWRGPVEFLVASVTKTSAGWQIELLEEIF